MALAPMFWQTTPLPHRPDAAARDGHRQRDARFVLRRRPGARQRAGDRALRATGRRGRRHARHRRRIDPSGRRAGAAARRSSPACCPCSQRRSALGVPVSVDTRKPEVMQAALDLGVDIVNDIDALRRRGALDVVAAHPTLRRLPDAHAGRAARDAAASRRYDDVVARGCARSCASASSRCEARGVGARAHRPRSRHRLRQDAGAQPRAAAPPARTARRSAVPLLVGWSRKSTLGAAHRPAASTSALAASVGGGRRWRSSAVRASCACTTSRRPSTRSRSGGAAAAR